MKLERIFADLHIHIGRTESGQSVKISAARNLTFNRIVQEAYHRKGMQMIGIIDAHSPPVQEEIVQGLERGLYAEHSEGGLVYGETTVILGCELEVKEPGFGVAHLLTYFPTFEAIQTFTAWLSKYMKNVQLSTQRLHRPIAALEEKVAALGGILIPAHVFTPFKSLYGKGVKKSLAEVFEPELIDAIELGLSSDTNMVKGISELNKYTFVTNSDAHSLGKLAREYQKMQLKEANFKELHLALQEKEGRKILANYGLNPLLGKYHSTACAHCGEPNVKEAECPNCGSHQFIKGVSIRIEELSDKKEITRKRPPYIHQVPLDFVPGVGPKTIQRLIQHFGTEMAVLHEVTLQQLEKVVSKKIAETIDLARKGKLNIQVGGGGVYGKITE